MTANHTQGPWQAEWTDGVFVDVVSGSVRIGRIDTDENNAGLGSQEGQANARLIAAAPDLLAALESMLETLIAVSRAGTKLDLLDSVIEARAAIAKAKGE